MRNRAVTQESRSPMKMICLFALNKTINQFSKKSGKYCWDRSMRNLMWKMEKLQR
jgi:hypothetical protein